MPDIGTAVTLLTSIIELKEVRAIRSAIRANLIAAGGVEAPLGNVEMPHPPSCDADRERGYYTLLPAPQIPPASPARTIVRHEPVVEYVRAVPTVEEAPPSECEPRPAIKSNPLAPPWHMPVEPNRCAARPVIKCPPKPPDVISKGTLLDFFV